MHHVQAELFDVPEPEGPDDLHYYVVAFSGGKDSLASLLCLLEEGADPESIELWHHEIDGHEEPGLMDWPVTPAYCEAVAEALKLPIYFSWKEGGFEREMLRENDFTGDVLYEVPEYEAASGNGSFREYIHDGSPHRLKRRAAQRQERYRGTRRRFPQVSSDLSVRWCSAYLKIDVAAAALRGQERFRSAKTLFVTGERAEESDARKGYETFEPHKADLRDGKSYTRHIDHWRPVHRWMEHDVWDIIERWRVNPHPCYHLGFGRCSCATCIFGSAHQFATVKQIAPERFDRVAAHEAAFGTTIKRDVALPVLAARGRPYEAAIGRMVDVALSESYDEPVLVENWQLPAGAFGESCGPT